MRQIGDKQYYQDCYTIIVYVVGWGLGVKRELFKKWNVYFMGQLGKAYGGEGSKITFRFLYWGLINQERKYRRRSNLGGNNDF